MAAPNTSGYTAKEENNEWCIYKKYGAKHLLWW